jgi:hypothetical protein
MLDRSVRNKRDELRKKSSKLRELTIDTEYLKGKEIIMKQDEIYKRWSFYNNLIKSMERVNYEMQDKKNK